MIDEDLRDWFGKGKKGGVGGGGWDRYNSSGDRIGKCGDAKEGEPYSACLSKEKASKLGKDGRAAFVRRKRDAQSKGGDAKKGGEQKKGQKPIKVKTGVSENLDPKTFKDTGKPSPYGSGYQELEERMNLFLEKNTPTMPDKWAYALAQAREKFDVYPSAYANAWASKKYKELGGGWRKSAKKESVLKLESDLLKVSKPYEIQTGDLVKNINKDCTHYKSTGEVVFVHDNGDITYQVNNQGATYTPGDQLTKSQNQLIKIFTHTAIPNGPASFI